jgi:hypothetical protein
MPEESGLQGWQRFIGRWETEGAHPMLPGEAIRGTSTFEWLDGQRFVIWRSHCDHSDIPDAITIIGVTDGQLSMHYLDQRGVYSVYAASLDQAERRYWREAPAPDLSASPARSTTTATRSRAEVSSRKTGVPGRTILLSTIRGWHERDRGCTAPVTLARGWVTASGSRAAARASVSRRRRRAP